MPMVSQIHIYSEKIIMETPADYVRLWVHCSQLCSSISVSVSVSQTRGSMLLSNLPLFRPSVFNIQTCDCAIVLVPE